MGRVAAFVLAVAALALLVGCKRSQHARGVLPTPRPPQPAGFVEHTGTGWRVAAPSTWVESGKSSTAVWGRLRSCRLSTTTTRTRTSSRRELRRRKLRLCISANEARRSGCNRARPSSAPERTWSTAIRRSSSSRAGRPRPRRRRRSSSCRRPSRHAGPATSSRARPRRAHSSGTGRRARLLCAPSRSRDEECC